MSMFNVAFLLFIVSFIFAFQILFCFSTFFLAKPYTLSDFLVMFFFISKRDILRLEPALKGVYPSPLMAQSQLR